MTVWMIRHAQSQSNAGQATVGSEDNGLSDLGKQQAQCIADVIVHPPDWIATSPYLRAQLTTQPLLDKFPQLHADVWQVQEFSYLAAPSKPVIPLQFKQLSQAYWEQCDPDYCDGERAESFRQLIQRVQETLIRIRQHEGFGIVFSHSLFIKALLWVTIAQPTQIDKVAMQRFHGFWRSFRVPNASILNLEILPNQQLSWSEFGIEHLPQNLNVNTSTIVGNEDLPT